MTTYNLVSRKTNYVLTSRMNERSSTTIVAKTYSIAMDMVGKRMPAEPEILGAGTSTVTYPLIVTSRAANYVLTSR